MDCSRDGTSQPSVPVLRELSHKTSALRYMRRLSHDTGDINSNLVFQATANGAESSIHW